ncbi:glycosyltransferase [Sediminibacter sp. Hel_I_10]|uniref:glycosyltransferase n=1 Tax=Sediminibacter sp. Hel_I_10 TaxID=1392490 RepID=UPI0006917B15|nr:glycosyltransferase [Sediminibacter sp. Hel_I_10]
MTLTIISHTEHYKDADGNIVGLGSTVTEINQLLEIFDEIVHIAMLHDELAPANTLAYVSDRIIFVPTPAVGGPRLKDKLNVIFGAPRVLGLISKYLDHSDYFQFRAPTGIGVYVLPYLFLFKQKKQGWFKYAGNWKQERPPLGYRFQRWLLQHQSRKVTINGVWDDQPEHCLSFENPCLTKNEVEEGQQLIAVKTFEFPIELCFVGRIEPEKGVDLFMESLSRLSKNQSKKIGKVHFVGTSEHLEEYVVKAGDQPVNMNFHGRLSRTEVHEIYKRCHAIVLPSASEGFPKVITEAMNYGCLPMVSNVSSIGQMIQDGVNGYLIEYLTVEGVQDTLIRLLSQSQAQYEALASVSKAAMEQFTYSHYNEHLLNTVLMK